MTKIFALLLALFILNGVFSQIPKDLIEGNTEFALDLYRSISKTNSDKNLFFSPYSISEAMAITYAGARKNTSKEIQDVMHYPQSYNELNIEFSSLRAALNKRLDSVSLLTANSLWAQKGYSLKQEYIENINNAYNAPLTYLNYKKKGGRKKALYKINSWTAEHTNNKITDLLSSNDLNKNTRLVIVNAIWFYGDWLKSFNEKQTKTGMFSSPKGEKEILFMRKQGKYSYYDDDLVQVLQLPYKGKKQSMFIFLPNKADDLSKFEKNFDAYYLQNIYKDMRTIDLSVRIPKFSSEFSIELKEELQKMGMHEAFSNQANFSGMTADNDLKIDKIIHKAKIELSEKGTEAAAATAVVMIRKTASIDHLVFNANHPFVYLIRDNETGTILFLGKYTMVE